MNTTPLHSAANELYAMLSPELRAELAKYERSMTVPAGHNANQARRTARKSCHHQFRKGGGQLDLHARIRFS